MKKRVRWWVPGSEGAVMSSLARPFFCSAWRLMASSVFFLGSPTTSHQFSSLRPGNLHTDA